MGLDINPNIFRDYDIRGVFGTDLTVQVMERIGRAYASHFVKSAVVVGMDGRKSGPTLKSAFIRGILDSGKDAIDVGLVPRGVCLVWAWKRKLPGAYITASHLPPEWNGVKFSDEKGIELTEEGNKKVGSLSIDGIFRKPKREGKLATVDGKVAIEQYQKHVISKVKKAGRPMRVLIDSGNGTGGLAAPGIFRKLGFTVDVMFGDVDGSFPNRPSEIDEKSLEKMKRGIVGYDAGVAYDGDADRMALMDEKGRLLGPEVTSKIILDELVKHESGPIIANVECLKIMDEIAGGYGRRIFRVPVGNSFMVRAIEEKNGCFGVERSGHFCIPSIVPMDDGLSASLYALSAVSRTGKKLSGIADGIPQYPFERFKVECDDETKFVVVENLKNRLRKEYDGVNTLDGVRVDFDSGWVLIRASNTGPAIRLSVEADDRKKLKELSGKFLKILMDEIKRNK